MSGDIYFMEQNVEYDEVEGLICQLAIEGNYHAIIDELIQLHRDKMYAFFKIKINQFKEENRVYARNLIDSIVDYKLNRGYLITTLILLSEHMIRSIENLLRIRDTLNKKISISESFAEQNDQHLASMISHLFEHDDVVQLRGNNSESIRIQQQHIHSGQGVEMEVVPFKSNIEDRTKLLVIELINMFLYYTVIQQCDNERQSRSILESIRYGSAEHLDKDCCTIAFWKKVILLTKPMANQPHKKIIDEETAKDVKDAGDVLSDRIFTGASFVKTGLKNYLVPFVNTGIEKIGETAKANSQHRDNTIMKDKELRGMEESLSITRDAVEFSDSIREGVQSLTGQFRDFSIQKFDDVKKVWKENEVGKKIIPDDDVRQVAASVGKVGVATLGAAGLIIEAVVESARDIGQTTVKVASDVTTHTHGKEAGEVVNNVGVTTGNVLRAVTHVASAKFESVARNTAKVNMMESKNKAIFSESNE